MEKYNPNLQKIFGAIDLGGVTSNDSNSLANKILVLILNGLNDSSKMPVGFFFVSNLTAKQVRDLTFHIIEKIEEFGFSVGSVVLDCICIIPS